MSESMNVWYKMGLIAALYIVALGCCDALPSPIFGANFKLGANLSRDDPAAKSFKQFIQSKPESIFVGEIKPNASEAEMMMLRSKIANTIMSMQQMEKSKTVVEGSEMTGNNCFIEVTKVERVPGKCHKVSNGLPICQSDNYMAINTDCN